MNNSKQWAKAIMAMAIGSIPILIASYTHATWYYIFFTICSLFGVLGLIALFQLFIYTILFPTKRNLTVRIFFYVSIMMALSIPIFWILHHEHNPQNLLKNNYEITEATLTDKKPIAGGNETTLFYTFEINGKRYNSTKNATRVPKTNYFYLKYLPEDPTVNEPADE